MRKMGSSLKLQYTNIAGKGRFVYSISKVKDNSYLSTHQSLKNNLTLLIICCYQFTTVYRMAQRLKNISSSIAAKPKTLLEQFRQNGGQFNAKQLRNLLFLPGNFEKYILPTSKFVQNRDFQIQQSAEELSSKEWRKEDTKMIFTWMEFLKLDFEKDIEEAIFAAYATTSFDSGMTIKTLLHNLLYAGAIKKYQSNLTHRYWFKRALELKDIGCFGLHEFLQSNKSQGVKTQATYDHSKKQFVLTSKDQSGMKLWIDGASKNATMTVILAELIVNGTSEGPHPFVVPLRCPITQQVWPGITIGGVEPKNGGNYNNNRTIFFDNVSLHKDNLLGKIGNIDQNGAYQSQLKTIDDRSGMLMSALLGGRGIISFMANVQAMNVLTDALRYTCSCQGNLQKAKESAIVDKFAIISKILSNYAKTLLQTAACNKMTQGLFQQASNQNLKGMAQLHALSASVKTLIIKTAAVTISETKTVLQDHGYSAYSRLSSLYHESDPSSMGEGDNNMLLQQTSKYLMRAISKKFPALILDLAFVHTHQAPDFSAAALTLRTPQTLEALMRAFFVLKYVNAKDTLAELLKSRGDAEEAWLHFHPRAGNALAIAYANFFVYSVGLEKVAAAQSPRIRQYLANCVYLWAFTLFDREGLGPLEFRKALQSQILALCEEMTVECVLVGDALDLRRHIAPQNHDEASKEEGAKVRPENYFQFIQRKAGS